MAGNILCKLGLHDWYSIKITNTEQLKENVRAKTEGRWPCTVITTMGAFPEKKICKRCHKIHDEISKYLPKIEKEVLEEMKLEKIAK